MQEDAAGSGARESARPVASDRVLAAVVRDEIGVIVGALARSTGSFDVAEEAAAAAVEDALLQWRRTGVPARPGAWLTVAARHNALDALRRERVGRRKALQVAADLHAAGDIAGRGSHTPEAESFGSEAPPDERLPLLFGCCHPALAPEAQLALTLRAVVGLTTAQIARATLEPEATVGQRISRAKRKMGAAGISLGIPEGAERADRLDIVLTVISVMYASAHLAPERGAAADRDLAEDALWLARVVAFALPDEAEAAGLHALLLFHRSREPARAAGDELVPLGEQDRALWDPALVAAGHAELRRAADLRAPGRWQLHAAIAACHADARSPADTDWLQMLVLYDMLLGYDGSPIVRLDRAVVLAEVAGPAPALAEVDRLGDALARFHLWHAVRARLLRRLGRLAEADQADMRALELTANDAERRLLRARLGRE